MLKIGTLHLKANSTLMKSIIFFKFASFSSSLSFIFLNEAKLNKYISNQKGQPSTGSQNLRRLKNRSLLVASLPRHIRA